MPRIRTLALVTAVAIGGTLLGSSIHACDDGFAVGCQNAVSPSSPAPEAFEHRPTKARSGHRTPHPRHDDPSPNVTAPSVRTPSDKAVGISARLFQRFVSKQSIATATVEGLRSPWLEPVLFAVTSLYAVGGGVIAVSDEFAMLSQAPSSDVANNLLKRATANEVSLDDHNDVSDASRRTISETRTAAPQTRASDNGPASVTWVELVFLVWGGLLTVGSGLRLIFG
jgi:hypothetical protein